MPARKERIGTVQGRLTVVRISEEKINNQLTYVCVCSCNPEKEILKTSTTLGAGTKSCGCLYRENALKQLEACRHMSITHNMSQTPTYIAWRNMKARCDDPNHQAYANYKARGINYCAEWATFEGFLKDMGECPEGLTLNRVDVNKGYDLNNCEWANYTKQGRDKRKPKGRQTSKYKGVSFNTKEGKYKGALRVDGNYYHLGYHNNDKILACRYDEKVLELTGSSGGTNAQLKLLSLNDLETYLDERGRTNLLSKEERSKLLANI